MKLKYQAKKDTRIKYRFMGVQIDREPDGVMYWWVEEEKRWSTAPPWNTGGISDTAPCRSVRAFRRRLREWNKYIPNDVKFVLNSRWIGYNVYS